MCLNITALNDPKTFHFGKQTMSYRSTITPYTKAFLTDNMILIPWKMIKLNIVGSIQHCFSHREGSTVLYVINSTIYTLIYSTSTITLPKHKITDLFRETMKADGTFVQIFLFSPKWIKIIVSYLDLAHKQINK